MSKVMPVTRLCCSRLALLDRATRDFSREARNMERGIHQMHIAVMLQDEMQRVAA